MPRPLRPGAADHRTREHCRSMNDPAAPSVDMPRPDFGVPEAEFRPTYGQTAAGLLVYGSITAACFACAFAPSEFTAIQRFAMGSVGVTVAGLTCWVYELRKWRLWICPGGVVQRRAWAVDEIAWPEVREVVVARRPLSRHPDHVVLRRAGSGGNVVIRPINCSKRKQLFGMLLKAVADRQITVRREVIWGD